MPMTLFDNRITRAIEATQIRYDDVDDYTRQSLEAAACMDPSDRAALGDVPTRGLIAGKLTADEANRLHAIHRSWAGASVAERIVFIRTAFELLKAGV